jgi:predicted methyltransferase
MRYPKDFLNKIVCGDAVKIMKQIPDGSIDLIITSLAGTPKFRHPFYGFEY